MHKQPETDVVAPIGKNITESDMSLPPLETEEQRTAFETQQRTGWEHRSD